MSCCINFFAKVFPGILLVVLSNGMVHLRMFGANVKKSETGRIRFRRARCQTLSPVSFFALAEFWGESSMSSSQPIICVPKRTHRVSRRTHRVCPKTQWGSVSTLLRNSTLETVFHPSPKKPYPTYCDCNLGSFKQFKKNPAHFHSIILMSLSRSVFASFSKMSIHAFSIRAPQPRQLEERRLEMGTRLASHFVLIKKKWLPRYAP